jgi:cytochrome c peroxidase
MAERPGVTDPGVWNIYANPGFPGPQQKLQHLLCREQLLALAQSRQGFRHHRRPCSKPALLQRSIANFKTPGLRDLGHSAPYMHNGQIDSLEGVLGFYLAASARAREHSLRNPAPALQDIRLDVDDIEPLAAFLRALNEDYE